MKIKHAIMTFAFALVAGLGAIGAVNLNKKVEVKEADAAANSYSFYVAVDTSSVSYSIQVYYNAGYDTTGDVYFTKTGHTYHGLSIFSGSIQDSGQATNFDGVYVKLMNGSTKESEIGVITSWGAFTHTGQMLLYSSNQWIAYSTDAYQIKCGSGSYIGMTWDDGGSLPSGVLGQFSATLDITAGQSLTIQKNTGSWGNLTVNFTGDSNNYHNGKVCVSVSSAKIYLKYKTDGTYEAWVPGYTACAVVVGSNEYVTNQSGAGDSANYDTALVYVEKNQTVAVSWNHNTIDTYLNGDSVSGCFTGSAGTVTCSLTGAYTIRVHNNGYGQHNTVYITRNDASSAKYLASKFNSDVLSLCDAGGNTNQSSLTSAWNAVAGHFTNQPAAITDLFVESSGDSDISRMMTWYRYIIQKYGTSVASDFLGKGYTKSSSQALSTLINPNNDNTATIIIVISTLSITSLGLFLFLKKRKESK